MKACINHIFRPTNNIPLPGYGDCRVCMPHPDNCNCAGYQPVQITIHGLQIEPVENTEQEETIMAA